MRYMLTTATCVLFGLSLTAEAQAPAAAEFVSKEGGFSVMLPGTPTESTEEALGQHQFQVAFPDGVMIASYQDNPGLKGVADAALATGLKDAQESVRAGFDGKVLKSQPIKLANKYPGLEFECDIPAAGGLYRSRSYLVDGRMYQLVAVGTKEFAIGANASTFLGSLKLLPK
jgi:hypothetical protein